MFTCTKVSKDCHTFKNCGVTNRTVATRQACSSRDDCRVRGNASSNPLQEDVGTEEDTTITLNNLPHIPSFNPVNAPTIRNTAMNTALQRDQVSY